MPKRRPSSMPVGYAPNRLSDGVRRPMSSRNPPFSPRQLFTVGVGGAWYDPSDLSTLFQDSAGTIPVTAVGDPVGKILDKSGNGNHATQTTAINRPILGIDSSGRYYLDFNGTGQHLINFSIPLTANYCCISGMYRAAAEDYIFTFGRNGSSGAEPYMGSLNALWTNAFLIENPSGPYFDHGEDTSFANTIGSAVIASRRASGIYTEYVNLTRANLNKNPSGLGPVETIGRVTRAAFGTTYAKGHIYGIVLVDALLNDNTFISLRNWMNLKTGAY